MRSLFVLKSSVPYDSDIFENMERFSLENHGIEIFVHKTTSYSYRSEMNF